MFLRSTALMVSCRHDQAISVHHLDEQVTRIMTMEPTVEAGLTYIVIPLGTDVAVIERQWNVVDSTNVTIGPA